MKYTVQSSKYVIKNFIYLFPFAIFPALFLAISTDKGALNAVLKIFASGDITDWSFQELFRAISVLNFGSWQSVVFGIVGIIVIVPSAALMMALLEKHFRIGKRTFNGLWEKLNDNFLSTCGYILLLLTIYELWTLLIAAFLFFVSRIAVDVVAYTLSVIVFLGMHVVLMTVIGAVYLWLPCMQITGFRAFEALQYSYQLVNAVKWRIVVAQLLVLLCVEALVALLAVAVGSPFVFMVLTALLYAGIIMVYCVRMQIAYFDCDHIEREDIPTYYK